MYVPKLECFSQSFANSILTDDKILLNRGKVKKVKVPKYGEFKMKEVFSWIEKDKHI